MSKQFTRTLRHGIQLATRKGFMAFTSTLVLTISAIVVVGALLSQALFTSAIGAIQQRVDINVFMLPGTPEATVNGLAENLKTLPEVTSAEVTTADQALVDFREKHKEDFLTLQALDELDNNPLGAIISVQSTDPASYEVIARYLSPDNTSLPSDYSGSIEKLNYFENKTIIDRLSKLQSNVQSTMIGIMILATVLTIIMVSAIVRSVIYALQQEIVLLKSLGSGNMFLYGQFMVAYSLYSLVAAIVALAVGYASSAWIDAKLVSFAPGVSVTAFLARNSIQLALVVLSVTLLIGWISCLVSVYISVSTKKKLLS
jgi:cell division transport system permease protein